MKRRLHMVPFTVTIPAAKRDKRLPDRLLAERDGILAWALQGCLEWQKTGLRPPPAVMAATDDYFEAEDALGRWIEERCQTGNKTFWAGSTELFNSWKSWAEANGEYAGSMKRFSETLTTRGFEKFKTTTTRGFRGSDGRLYKWGFTQLEQSDLVLAVLMQADYLSPLAQLRLPRTCWANLACSSTSTAATS